MPIFMIAVTVCAQFPDHIALGPAARVSCSETISRLRMSGRVRVPGNVVDIEVDPASLSAFLDREAFSQLGVSWLSLVWVPPFMIGRRVPVLKRMSLLLMGLNGILNAQVGLGNAWIRGTLGWKNDVFLFREFLWVAGPEIGCKVSLPRSRLADGAIRVSVEFPAMIGTYRDFVEKHDQFSPRLSVGIDVLPVFGDIYLRGRRQSRQAGGSVP